MNLPFPPVKSLFSKLETALQKRLISRGEAHITVVTPVEYWNILRPKGVTIEEINRIAENFEIQHSRFFVHCLGEGKANVEGNQESTYFLVVSSDDLIELRRRIQTHFILKGGSPSQFDPLKFYPHITVGFTKIDLHESNGVIKNTRSCVTRIRLIK